MKVTGVADLIIPSAWESLAAEPFLGPVLLLGASDTGKTSLALVLVHRWVEQGLPTALLDCDVGQSSQGLPATMNLRAYVGGQERDYAYFVGSVTPRRHMLPMLIGIHRLYQKARSIGVEAVVVDTTGLVDPAQGGAALKHAEIELLMPCKVIALARDAELNPILRSWENHPAVPIARLRVPPQVRIRSRSERVRWRRQRWESYFQDAHPTTFPYSTLAMMDWVLPTAQKICAFSDAEGLCLGLGRVIYLDRKTQSITVETPLRSLENVVALRFGPPALEERVLGDAEP